MTSQGQEGGQADSKAGPSKEGSYLAQPGQTLSQEASSEEEVPPRASRKLTKTSCLTCRKRRIKCGEERPTCANCIKSKRQCEGYSPR
ncbi:uncharacterized protein BDR25DRAFT_234006, partial [Lindgomyces ingoldianus]